MRLDISMNRIKRNSRKKKTILWKIYFNKLQKGLISNQTYKRVEKVCEIYLSKASIDFRICFVFVMNSIKIEYKICARELPSYLQFSYNSVIICG